MRDPAKGHAALRRGRWSTRYTLYFVTVCLKRGDLGLDDSSLFTSALGILRKQEGESINRIHGLVMMPDHLHLLIELGKQTGLNEAMRLFKGRMTPVLRSTGLHWQPGFYDRRLRDRDPVGVVLRYMQLNPYRKALIKTDTTWPFWYCSKEALGWMGEENENGTPLPEWLS